MSTTWTGERRRRITWSPEDYEKAMSYAGRVSAAVAERLTGVPQGTIRKWWSGQRPKHLYVQAQKAGEYFVPQQNPLPPDEKRRRVLEAKRRNNRKHWKRYDLRHRGVFHPTLNPDPELAPLHHLWLPGQAVLAFIRERYTDAEVGRQFDRGDGSYKRFTELVAGRPWIRFDSTDRLFVHLGLVISEMDLVPTYSTTTPKEDPVAA